SLPVAKDMHARIDLRGKAPESLNSTDAGKSVARLLSGSGTLDKRGRKVASTSDVGRQETSRNELERNNMKANHRVRERKSREKSLLAGAMVGGVMLSDEHQERRRLQIRALIALGKERGYLTHAEIHDHLPEDIVDPEAIEGIITAFNDMGITVCEQAPDVDILLMSDNAITVDDTEDAEAAVATALSSADAEFGRTTDP